MTETHATPVPVPERAGRSEYQVRAALRFGHVQHRHRARPRELDVTKALPTVGDLP